MTLDLSNTYGVARTSDGRIQVPMARLLAMRGLSDDEALVLAAWLVATADPGGVRFADVWERVRAEQMKTEGKK